VARRSSWRGSRPATPDTPSAPSAHAQPPPEPVDRAARPGRGTAATLLPLGHAPAAEPPGRARRVGRSEPAGHRSGQRAPVVSRPMEIGEKVRRREGRSSSQPGPPPRSRPSLRPPQAPLNRVRSSAELLRHPGRRGKGSRPAGSSVRRWLPTGGRARSRTHASSYAQFNTVMIRAEKRGRDNQQVDSLLVVG
jgi:hypothetical protein